MKHSNFTEAPIAFVLKRAASGVRHQCCLRDAQPIIIAIAARAGRFEETDPRDCRDASLLLRLSVYILLRREGWHVNAKRVYRLYSVIVDTLPRQRRNMAQ